MPKPKVSIVKYLNAMPLAWGILHGPQAANFEPILSTPAECADQLQQGKVDIGLIPSIEYQRIPGTRIIAGPAVACRHRVRSVLLVSNVPLWKVRTVAADNTSRTSVILARILLEEFYQAKPEFKPAPPDLESMLAQNDAALVIGDVALKFMQQHEQPNAEKQKAMLKLGPQPLQVFDLVERWKLLTGLPFIFAFWASRPGFNDPGATAALRASRDFGMANVEAIVEQFSQDLSMPKEFLREYLLHNVHYYMDRSAVEGLQLFYDMAARIGAIKSQRPLELV